MVYITDISFIMVGSQIELKSGHHSDFNVAAQSISQSFDSNFFLPRKFLKGKNEHLQLSSDFRIRELAHIVITIQFVKVCERTLILRNNVHDGNSVGAKSTSSFRNHRIRRVNK